MFGTNESEVGPSSTKQVRSSPAVGQIRAELPRDRPTLVGLGQTLWLTSTNSGRKWEQTQTEFDQCRLMPGQIQTESGQCRPAMAAHPSHSGQIQLIWIRKTSKRLRQQKSAERGDA